MRMVFVVLILSFLALEMAHLARAQDPGDGHKPASPYAGEETRKIKSLSPADIAELRRGGGWGLAKAAELNGVPGPAHLLELKDDIPLTPEQVEKIQIIFEEMQSDAIKEGERLIEHERALDDAFRKGDVSKEKLRHLVSEIGKSRSALRYIHLTAHLATPELLTEEQMARYSALRGYGSGPCAAVPAGHDPVMWRRHHGCD